jgi:hypothetical protein
MQAVSTLYVFRHANQKSVRSQIHMMPIGTPRVAYRTPGEGSYQWIDLWNALVSCYILIYIVNCTLMTYLKDIDLLCDVVMDHM